MTLRNAQAELRVLRSLQQLGQVTTSLRIYPRALKLTQDPPPTMSPLQEGHLVPVTIDMTAESGTSLIRQG